MAFRTVSHVGFTCTGAMPEFIYMLDNQTQHIAAIMDEFMVRGSKYVEASRYVLPPDEIRRRMQGPKADDVVAANQIRLGRYLYTQSKLEGAKDHFNGAVRLCLASWKYRPLLMMLDPERVGEFNGGPDFFTAFDADQNLPYYPEADLPKVGG